MGELSASNLNATCCAITFIIPTSYGFNLHAEKGRVGQYIGKVDEASPAELAGLRQGDRIIEVNSVNIDNESHKQVVERIKKVANHTTLLVIDPKADIHSHQQMALIDKFKANGSSAADDDHKNNNGTTTTKTPTMTTNSNSSSSSSSTKASSPVADEPSKAASSPPVVAVVVENNNNNNISNNNGTPRVNGTSNGTSSNGTGVLNLPMTVAEMRAQLKNKKRADPKTEGLDVRKKYEIIQKM